MTKDVSFEEKVAFRKARGYCMEIDSEGQDAPKEMVSSSPHPPTIQRESVEPVDLVDLIDCCRVFPDNPQ